MLGTVIFYSVLLSSFIIINGLEDGQLDAILKLINNQAGNAKLLSSEVIGRGDDTNDLQGQINIEDVIKLIKQAKKNKDSVQEYPYSQKYKGKPNPLNQFHRKPQYESKSNKETINRLWEQLLEQEPAMKQSYHKRLPQNKLLSPKQYELENEVEKESKSGSNEYSKIYVVLDPIALQKSRNNKNLPNLLSRILTETFSVVDRSPKDRSKAQRYKGFLVKNGLKTRRYRRESKEGGDSGEYRPKRSRNEHNSGGGGGSGRTAIPYVRQRGDIYERDH